MSGPFEFDRGNDVYGYDTDGDGFIDTPDRGSFFGYDFDGDGDIDWQDDSIGFMLHEQAQKQWSYQPTRRLSSASASGTDWGWGSALFLVLLFLLSNPFGWAILAVLAVALPVLVVAKATESVIQRFGKSGIASKIGKRAEQPAKKRRFPIGRMTQRQSVIIIILGFAVLLEFCAIGAAVLWTMNQTSVP